MPRHKLALTMLGRVLGLQAIIIDTTVYPQITIRALHWPQCDTYIAIVHCTWYPLFPSFPLLLVSFSLSIVAVAKTRYCRLTSTCSTSRWYDHRTIPYRIIFYTRVRPSYKDRSTRKRQAFRVNSLYMCIVLEVSGNTTPQHR